MKPKRLFLVLLCLPLLLAGCGAKPPDAAAAMEALCQSQASLPAGQIYVLSAPTDDAAHPSDTLLSALFGNGRMPIALDLVEDAAFFLSYASPCELAVFYCKTADGTEDVAKMCLQRLDTLKHYWTDDASVALLERAGVTVRGTLVLLYVCNDPDAALRAFRRTL
ncbi:MAG: hypothetical protein IJX28_08625 [Clostridia bacterium]|nr:hypothetical protein [Clostridia bacterium]